MCLMGLQNKMANLLRKPMKNVISLCLEPLKQGGTIISRPCLKENVFINLNSWKVKMSKASSSKQKSRNKREAS